MADKKINIKELEKLYAQQKQLSENEIELLNMQLNELGNVLDAKKRIAIENQIAQENQKILNAMVAAQKQAIEEGYDIHVNTNKALLDRQKEQQKLINNQRIMIKNQQTMLKFQDGFKKNAKIIWDYLMQSDKVIKSTILNLGMSGVKAEEMRSSFEGSAAIVARLGGNLGDIQTIMEGFANETGRARALTSEMVNDVYVIGKGTGLGVEQATKLAAQFELMGINSRSAMEFAQGVVETSELMGVNTVKVLKNISDNFEQLQKMTFTKGVKAFGQMAQYAEKFNVDMSQALTSADKLRGLEKMVDLTANLQVLGGEFAKTDPFQMLYQARNAPDEFQKSINNMIKGLATFRKNSDGTFESFISPADIDRMRIAEEALGLQTGELTKQARRMNEIQVIRQHMIGMGLSSSEKELVEGMTVFNTETGKFMVKIGNVSRDLHTLTSDQLKAFTAQKTTLEERAKHAQTFDEAFKSTIEEFKTILLPMLRGVNQVLGFVRPIAIKFNEAIDNLSKNVPGLMKFAGALLAGGFLLKKAILPLIGLVKSGGIVGGLLKGGASASSAGGMNAAQMLGQGKMASGMGKQALGKGVGTGLAGAGIGAGVMLAADGISRLADSMSKLNKDQISGLVTIGTTLAITFPAAAIGITLAGKAAEASAVGIGVLTLAVLGIGAAISLATNGLGKMAEGFASLRNARADSFVKMTSAINSSKGDFREVERTVKSISQVDFSNLKQLTSAVKPLKKLSKVSTIFGTGEEIEKVKNAIMAISRADFSNMKQLSSLNNILNKPLRVEFAQKEVAVVSNISMNIDGYKFYQKTNAGAVIRGMDEGGKSGKYAYRG